MRTCRNLKALVIIASLLITVVVVAGWPGRTLARTAVPHTEGVTSYASRVTSHASRVASSVVIDHNTVDADAIPQDWLDQARVLDTFFAHMSVGSNILDGMADLQAQDPGRYTIAVHYGGPDWFADNDGILHRQVGSNQYPQTKIDGFDNYIRNSGFHVADVAMLKFCPSDVPPFASMPAADTWVAYRDMMEALERDYPDITFVWWTFPLSSASDNRGNDEKAVFNDSIRDYCVINDCVLFDIAAIESHDPSGNPVVSSTGHEAMWDGYTDDGGHLNETGRQRVAHAMWWLLARVAGWTGADDQISVTAVTDVASVHQGETATYALAVVASEGFTTPVALSLQGPPGGTSVVFEPNPVIPPGNSQLYVTTTASTVAGTYPMTVTGTAGALSDAANVTLIVASAAPSFTLGISPTTRAAAPNQTVSYPVAVTGINGFSQPVILVGLGLPAGVGKAWSTNPVTPGDLSILTLSIPSSPSYGRYPFYVVGTSGTQVVAKGVELIIDYPFKAYLPILLK